MSLSHSSGPSSQLPRSFFSPKAKLPTYILLYDGIGHSKCNIFIHNHFTLSIQILSHPCGFLCDSAGRESVCNAGDLGQSLGWEDPLEKGKTTHSNILAWRIPWTVHHGLAKSRTRLSGLLSLHSDSHVFYVQFLTLC